MKTLIPSAIVKLTYSRPNAHSDTIPSAVVKLTNSRPNVHCGRANSSCCIKKCKIENIKRTDKTQHYNPLKKGNPTLMESTALKTNKESESIFLSRVEGRVSRVEGRRKFFFLNRQCFRLAMYTPDVPSVSGRHVGVQQMYTNMASPYFQWYICLNK